MANECWTAVIVDGKRKDVKSLFSKMNNLEKRKRPLVGSDYGNTWLGCLVTKLGGDWRKIYCRGGWSDLEYNGAILRFNTITAWAPMTEVFDFIKTVYPSLEVYYQAEEDGMGVFVTNDTEGRYFKDRFRVETDCDYEYFASIEGVCEYVSGIIGKTVSSREEMEAAINDWNDELDANNDDQRIYFVEYEVVTD